MVVTPSSNSSAALRTAPDRVATGLWLAAAFVPALAIAVAVLAARGVDNDAVRLGLKITARWSYLWFWCAYAGGALAAIVGSRLTPMAKHGREFGLAFAAAQTVHAGLVLSLYVAPFDPPSARTLAIFGPALGLMYLLAALSFRGVAAPFPSGVVRWIRFVGVEYIGLAFLYDFAKNPFGGGKMQLLAYLPFQLLVIAAVGLRIAAYVRRGAERKGSAA